MQGSFIEVIWFILICASFFIEIKTQTFCLRITYIDSFSPWFLSSTVSLKQSFLLNEVS